MYNDLINILIVDDHQPNLLALANILRDPTTSILTAKSGNDALALLLEYDFAVVLMDVCMPDMDGFETASVMRSHEKTRNTPIIFVTAVNRDETHALRGYELGAVDYLFKPLQQDIVQSKVRVFVDLAKQKRKIEKQNVELVAVNVDLFSARQEADRANAAKSAFLAHMSHEIRTPLASIIGFSELLLKSSFIPEAELDQLRVIRRNGRHLIALVNDILDLSKIEAGKIDVELAPFALLPELRTVESMFLQQAHAKGIRLYLQYEGLVPEQVTSDTHKVRQILINLVGNAVKFTSRGEVRIGVRMQNETTTGSAMLEIRVTDTGCGIPTHCRDKVLKPFIQADSSVARKFGGTGLGLSLSKKLAQHLGGEIVVEDTVEEVGTTFLFSFDPGSLFDVRMLTTKELANLDYVSAPLCKSVPSKVLNERKILLAEDSEDLQWLLSTILRSAGATVTLAHNGKEAVALARSELFDLILMDVEMPVMGGREATQTLRASGFKQPILGLTAHALSNEIEKTIAAGCNAHISKPVDVDQLISEIAKWIAGFGSTKITGVRSRAAVDVQPLAQVIQDKIKGSLSD